MWLSHFQIKANWLIDVKHWEVAPLSLWTMLNQPSKTLPSNNKADTQIGEQVIIPLKLTLSDACSKNELPSRYSWTRSAPCVSLPVNKSSDKCELRGVPHTPPHVTQGSGAQTTLFWKMESSFKAQITPVSAGFMSNLKKWRSRFQMTKFTSGIKLWYPGGYFGNVHAFYMTHQVIVKTKF